MAGRATNLSGMLGQMAHGITGTRGTDGLLGSLGAALAPQPEGDVTTAEGLAKLAQDSMMRGDNQSAMQFMQQAQAMRSQAQNTANAERNFALKQNRANELSAADSRDVAETAREREQRTSVATALGKGPLKDRPDLVGAVEAGLMTPKNAIAAVEDTSGAAADFDVGTASIVKDKKGNMFYTAPQDNKRGGFSTVISPLPGSPAEPVGELTVVQKRTGQTATEKTAEETRGLWLKKRSELIDAYPALVDQKVKITRGLELAGQVPTSGVRKVANDLKNFFGLEGTADAAVLNNAMADFVLGSIKKLGVNPTDTDLRFITDSVAGLQKSTDANIVLFEQAMEVISKTVESREWLIDNPSASQEEYAKQYKRIKEAETEKTVQFGDLK